jgi:hypothetical protein
MRRASAVLVASLVIVAASRAEIHAPPPDPWPFGRITDDDVARLCDYATKNGFDLKAELTNAYSLDRKIGDEALGRVFRFCRVFRSFDKNAHTYGQIIKASFLNLGEVLGVEHYVRIIDRQPPDVQQRIRDFLFYPISIRVPREQWDEAARENREVYPTLFPSGFQFGRNDPLFQ